MEWNLLSTDGRLRRRHYLVCMLALGCASAAIQAFAEAILAQPLATIATFVLSPPLCIAGYRVSVRRAHDMGWSSAIVIATFAAIAASVLAFASVPVIMSGPKDWWALKAIEAGLYLLLLSFLLALIMAVTPKDPRGANQWGDDPRRDLAATPRTSADHSASKTSPSMEE